MATQAKNRPRLGRGLSSLISVSNLPVESDVENLPPESVLVDQRSENTTLSTKFEPVPSGQPLNIPINSIRPNPHQPRKTIREDAIAELAASLKSTGVIQPIIVRQVEEGYELIAGERRWLASKLAGLSEVPAIVRNVDSAMQAQMALIENIQREDLNPIDRAEGYRTLLEQLTLTQAELAGRMGEDRSSVANYLRLLDLVDVVRQMVRDGRLSMGHAKLLAGVPDVLKQQQLAETVLSQNLSVRGLERLIQEENAVKPTRVVAGVSAHLQDLEKTLSRQLGMRVQVRSGSQGKGRLLVHYASLDQFDDLMQRLGVKLD